MRHNYCSLFPRDLISQRGYFCIFQFRGQPGNQWTGARPEQQEGNESPDTEHLQCLLSLNSLGPCRQGAGGQAPSVRQVGPRQTIPELSTMLGKGPQRLAGDGPCPHQKPT